MSSYFFREIQLITVLLLICGSYMSWSTRFVSIKLMWDFPFLIPFSSSLYFCSSKCMDSLTLERHNSFQNENNIKATHSFTSRPLIKFQQEVLKFNDTFWVGAPPKTDMVTNFLNLENRSFENVSFPPQQ